ncbi:MAG: DUF1617 family protein [Carnobacterium sp.]|uniref:DUF1617 family protein n=1 Tax=Carnobacterium sp. TaxID=48221 RepID=UPI003314AEF3
MKTIKLENQMIIPVFQFLQDATLVGKATRGRNQFLKRLEEKSKEFNEVLTDIRKEYFVLDKEGELKVEDGKYVFKSEADKKDLDKKIKELDEEECEIQFGEYSTKYDALFTALDSYEEGLSGQKALGYNELMDAFEANEDKTGEEN